jgi:hypothetical protein
VFPSPSRFGIGVSFLILFLSQAPGQDYRQYFKKPETTKEYWEALNFEIQVGKYDQAASLLKALLAKSPTDEELLQIEAERGMSAFLRLLTIPQLRADAGPLVERVTAAVKQKVSDPERINRFIKNLSASPPERAYAITELRRAGAAAVPHLVAALRATADPAEHNVILNALVRLDRDAVPPLLAALDVGDNAIRAELIDVLQRRGDPAAAPGLWHPAAAARQPDFVRRKATEALAALLGRPRDYLGPAKEALTREAERYYRHQVKLPSAPVTVWRWDEQQKQLVSDARTVSQAEEYYGLRYARLALELDPTYQPAQVVFLSLALEKGFERAGLDQPLATGAPEVKNLVGTVNRPLLAAVLERALADRRLAVILGAVRALGDLSAASATKATGEGTTALVQALNFPDRRIQMAAADALLRIGGPAQGGARLVEVLRRALAAHSEKAQPKALVGYANLDFGHEVGKVVQQAGFEPVVVQTGRDALRRLGEAADIDVLVLDHALSYPELPNLLAQLRADINYGLLPVLVTAPADREASLRRLTERYRNVWIVPLDSEALKRELPARIADAMGRPLSEAERKAFSAEAVLWLARLARGEVAGYDLRPAERAILEAIRSDELGALAIEAAGRLPGRTAQSELATAVLDSNRPAPLQAAAAAELSRHLQRYGLGLTNDQVKALEALYNTTEDAKLKGNVAVVLGSMRPDARRTGERLQAFSPLPPAPPQEK